MVESVHWGEVVALRKLLAFRRSELLRERLKLSLKPRVRCGFARLRLVRIEAQISLARRLEETEVRGKMVSDAISCH